MFMNMRDEAIEKRCVHTPLRAGARLMVMGTWQMDYMMAIVMQQTGIRLMAIGIRHLYFNLDIEATHSYQSKITTTQWTRTRLMVTSA